MPEPEPCCEAFRTIEYGTIDWSRGNDDYGANRDERWGYYLTTSGYGCASCGPTNDPTGPRLSFCPFCGKAFEYGDE